MGNKVIKIFSILFLVFSLSFIYNINVSKAGILDDYITKGKQFLVYTDSHTPSSQQISEENIKEINSNVYNILLGIAVAAAFIGITFLGLRFITSSAEGKAEIKERLIPFMIGCIVVFGAFTIWKIAIEILEATGL